MGNHFRCINFMATRINTNKISKKEFDKLKKNGFVEFLFDTDGIQINPNIPFFLYERPIFIDQDNDKTLIHQRRSIISTNFLVQSTQILKEFYEKFIKYEKIELFRTQKQIVNIQIQTKVTKTEYISNMSKQKNYIENASFYRYLRLRKEIVNYLLNLNLNYLYYDPKTRVLISKNIFIGKRNSKNNKYHKRFLSYYKEDILFGMKSLITFNCCIRSLVFGSLWINGIWGNICCKFFIFYNIFNYFNR